MIFTSSVRAHHCLNVASISAIFVILCDSQVTEMPTILMIGSPAILGREQEISCSISASIDTPETPFPLTWTRSDMPDTTVNSLRTGSTVSSHQVAFTSLIRFNVTFNDHNVNFTCTMANGTSESLKLSVIQLPEDPTISGPEYVNDSESFTWTCRVDGASYAPPRVQWLNNRGMLITLGVNTTFTDYWNEYNVRIFNVTSNLTLSFHLETSKNFGITCRSIHEASKTTKDSPYFKITIEKTQNVLKGDNTSSETQKNLKGDNTSSEMPTVSLTGSPAIIGHEQEISCSISTSSDTSETPFPLTWTRSDRPNETLNAFSTRTVRINNQVTFVSLIKINVTFSDHDVTFTCTMANGKSRYLKISVIQPPDDPTISGPEYVNDTESHTWMCRVGGASYAPPQIQWFNNRGMPITRGVHTVFTEYWNQFGVRLFNVTSNLTLAFYLETSNIFGMTCRSIHEASKTTKDSPYFKITIEKTRKDFKRENSTSEMPTILMIGSPAILGREQEITCSISASYDTPETPFPLTWTRSDRPNETLNPFRTRTVRSNNQVTFISLIKFNVTFDDHDVTFTCKTANGTSNSMKLLVIQVPEDPTICGPEYVNDNESYTWTCRVDGASYAPPRVQWLNNRGMPITLGVNTTFTDYWNEYNIRIFEATSNLTLTIHWAISQIFGVTCRYVLEASKITKDSQYFKITIKKTQTDFNGTNYVSVIRSNNCCYVLNHYILLITICLITSLQKYV